MAEMVEIGIIGGSGLYQMAEVTDIKRLSVETPFGKPSSDLFIGSLRGKRVAFLPRHGEGHIYPPNDIPQRANMYALKALGVRFCISVSACGSLRQDYQPGDVVIPNQLVDFTLNRGERTFFDGQMVAHISVADPFCETLRQHLIHTLRNVEGATVHPSGTYLIEDGPRFATRAESLLFRSWGCDIIGMTTAPEAFLAREAEIAYAVIAHVTDYDSWHAEEAPVTVDMVLTRLNRNIRLIQAAVAQAVEHLDVTQVTAAHTALDFAITTDRDYIPQSEIDKLRPIVARSLGL